MCIRDRGGPTGNVGFGATGGGGGAFPAAERPPAAAAGFVITRDPDLAIAPSASGPPPSAGPSLREAAK
eukprot:11468038-Alexandrium_andersonii.AAC.1